MVKRTMLAVRSLLRVCHKYNLYLYLYLYFRKYTQMSHGID